MGEETSQLAVPEVSVIIPARNEELSLGRCLRSLTAQGGVAVEILVVDDHSTDRTRAIADSFAGVRVLAAPDLPPGWTGKNHAVWVGSREARGPWLLFTDADTVHLPGSLAAALAEAKQHGVALLSYSPEQEVRGFWERAVMPVIFGELASAYRPEEVSDPASPVAAANGQYMLISRVAYDAVGGHQAMANAVLEDVELARRVKHAGLGLRFRLGRGAVRARMYRSLSALREGWTKNLALLFPNAKLLAARRAAEFVLMVDALVGLWLAARVGNAATLWFAVGATLLLGNLLRRVRRAHFGALSNTLALLGLPFFSYLLLRSVLCYRSGRVTWKGRTYPGPGQPSPK